MSTISTISELLQLSDSQYRIFDLGRKIDKLSKSHFEKIEQNQLPYPFPSQGHAFFAIAFWQKQATTPYLWFIKLPLDERGLLNQGARNHFIAIIIEALGSDLTVDPTEQQEKLLSNNPYHFTPSQYKLASLNSIIKVELKQAPNQHFNTFFSYLSESEAWDNWHNIGVQGITDFAARIDIPENAQILHTAFDHLPKPVLLPLCTALENQILPEQLISVICNRILQPKNSDDNEVQTHLIRSLASNTAHPYVINMFDELINNKSFNEEDFITIAGRCWSLLENDTRMMMFLENLISSQDPSQSSSQSNMLFNAIFKDLVAIPSIRTVIFQCMRNPERSPEFAQAIGQLFNQAQG